jgi:hypothetical protein
VFWRGARVKHSYGLLGGDCSDGRRLAMFSSMDDVNMRGTALRKVVKQQMALLRS